MPPKSRLVYSTDGNNTCDECERPLKKCQCSELESKETSESDLNIYFEKKGRKGSGVTVISNLILTRDELKNFAGNLKKYCGVGGSIKNNNQIELQGDQRQKLKIYLHKLAN